MMVVAFYWNDGLVCTRNWGLDLCWCVRLKYLQEGERKNAVYEREFRCCVLLEWRGRYKAAGTARVSEISKMSLPDLRLGKTPSPQVWAHLTLGNYKELGWYYTVIHLHFPPFPLIRCLWGSTLKPAYGIPGIRADFENLYLWCLDRTSYVYGRKPGLSAFWLRGGSVCNVTPRVSIAAAWKFHI